MSESPNTTTRPTFEQEVLQKAHTLALELLASVPELEALAIIPSWNPYQDRLHPAMVVGREGRLRHPAEMMRMSLTLHRTLSSQLDNFVHRIGELDEHAGNLFHLITQRQQELNALEQQLLVTRASAGAGGPSHEPRSDLGRTGG